MSTSPVHPAPEFLTLQTALAGRYSLERELGRGGMGIVFLAREVALDRMVALKLLPPEMAARPGLKERFLKEARTAAGLSHPNIVPIYAVDEVDGLVFFVMAYIEGGTLGERIRDRGPLPHSEASRVLREVAWALGHAHLQGVIHRDVKPDNILLEEGSGRAMVTDFGIAILAEETGDEAPTQVMGTAEFMSPEQARGGEVDARSDMYSLACVGFYAISGKVPFTGSTPAAVLAQHLEEPAPLLSSTTPNVPPAVATALDRCLRKEPDRRYSGGEALADALLPDLEVDKELPVPLRVFIKQSREFESILSWCGMGMMLVVPSFLVGLVAGAGSALWAFALPAAALLGLPLMQPARYARKLLRSGFTRDDATAAFIRDIDRREEEFRFEVGERVTWLDRILRIMKIGGFSVAALSFPFMVWYGGSAEFLFAASWTSGWTGLLYQELRARRRGDIMGERWHKLWKGRLGRWFFKLGGLALKRVAPAVAGVHRPTEIVIGLAADRLYEELPKETRRTLKGLPETVQVLEDDAQSLRKQVSEMEVVLAEIGDDDPSLPSAQDRAQARANVEATRDEAQEKLRDAVAALETIRLGLLRMHAGSGTVESLTMELESARDLSDDMENLLAGHREVERILQERRKTGVFTIASAESETEETG